MKKTKKTLLYAILTLVWTGVIFAFSLQPANASASLSGGLLQRLLDFFFRLTTIKIQPETVHWLFRKFAHLGEFMVLGMLSYAWVRSLKKSRIFSLGYCVLVAVSDEIIQFFTGGGRSMRLTDMGIDTLGASLGIVVISVLSYLATKRKKKHS